MSTGPDDNGHGREPLSSWQQFQADFLAEYQPPDRTPLSEAELNDLRARLNSPGGSRLGLSERERSARWQMGIIRPPEVVAHLHAQVQREKDLMRTRPSSRAMGEGILHAIEFATGQRPTAPITGQLAEQHPPAVSELTRVQVLAEDIAAGQVPDRSGRGRDYAVGVEHTIMWLLASTDQRPWPSGE